MYITYYKKPSETSNVIATFGVHIPQWHMNINNLTVLKSKDGGWFITMPNFKPKGEEKWEKVICFEKQAQENFVKAIRKTLEDYTKEKGETIS